MNKKQKTVLIRIIAAAVLTITLHFTPVEGIPQLLLYLVPYLIIGWDVLRKAFLGIRGGQVFDENFLMAVATIGAMALGSYGEGVKKVYDALKEAGCGVSMKLYADCRHEILNETCREEVIADILDFIK